jgi:hypothetical protein
MDPGPPPPITFSLASGKGSTQSFTVHMITRLFSAALRGVDALEVEGLPLKED